jgi:hypothetical protein
MMFSARSIDMTKKSSTAKGTKKRAKVVHPGMMGDGTEEQNLGERGNPAARVRRKDVIAAFGKKRPVKKSSPVGESTPVRASHRMACRP